MKKVKAKITDFFLREGHYYWVSRSDFHGGCWHVYVAPNKDAWIYNIFKEEEYKEEFEEVEGEE